MMVMTQPQTPSDEGCWMQTYTGRIFYPLKPTMDTINITDIAASLSKLCRFGGHVQKFYSVAEHCVLCASQVPDEYKLTALLHDASEAYLVDIPRPIKPYLTNYKEIASNLMLAIADRFDFYWPMPDEVKNVDLAILSDERAQTMAFTNIVPQLWGNTLPPLGVDLQFWSPNDAFGEFMRAFHKFGGVA